MRQILLEFIKAVNEHDTEKIYELMADDHVFIDAHGNEFKGKEKMKEGWKGYFEWFPDYNVEIKEISNEGNLWYMFGFASGTYSVKKKKMNNNFWRLPAAWKVIIENGKIKLWQIYADTKIPFDIIEANK